MSKRKGGRGQDVFEAVAVLECDSFGSTVQRGEEGTSTKGRRIETLSHLSSGTVSWLLTWLLLPSGPEDGSWGEISQGLAADRRTARESRAVASWISGNVDRMDLDHRWPGMDQVRDFR